MGLPPDYLRAQFGAWRDGARRAAAPDCMGQIAQNLSLEDISAVSAWLGVQAPVNEAAPPLNTKLPLACGSVGQ